LKRREEKRAENNMLVAQGIGGERFLMPDAVETIAKNVVDRIKATVQDGDKVYVLGSRQNRIGNEAFACVTKRGNGTRLISDEDGGPLTAKKLKKIYRWKLVMNLYKSTCPFNVNKVKKHVHQLLFENDMSIWLVNGAGGVKPDNKHKVLMFSLSIIHGPRDGLRFAAKHPRKLCDLKQTATKTLEVSSDSEEESEPDSDLEEEEWNESDSDEEWEEDWEDDRKPAVLSLISPNKRPRKL
jgi:hypothetical protein